MKILSMGTSSYQTEKKLFGALPVEALVLKLIGWIHSVFSSHKQAAVCKMDDSYSEG